MDAALGDAAAASDECSPRKKLLPKEQNTSKLGLCSATGTGHAATNEAENEMQGEEKDEDENVAKLEIPINM